METGIFAAFSKKVVSTIIAVGSMFYSTIDGTTPSMSAPTLNYKNDNIYASAVIDNCFTEDLDQILHSGNVIPMYFSVELYQQGAKSPDSTFNFYHALKYSPIGNEFSIYLSEHKESISGLSLDQVKALFPRVKDFRIFSSKDIKEDAYYYIKITSWLDKINLEGLEEELNLLFYWNSIKPNNISTLFTKSDFQL